MNRIRKIQRTAQIARTGSVSPVTSRYQKYNIAVAQGSLLPLLNGPATPWMRIDCIMEIAEKIAKIMCRGSNDPEAKAIIKYGLISTWSVRDLTTKDDQKKAQNDINQFIRDHPPSQEEVMEVYEFIANEADKFKNAAEFLTQNEMVEYTRAYEMDPEWPKHVIRQKAQMASFNVHWLPGTLIDNQAPILPRDIYERLRQIDENGVDTTQLVTHIYTTDNIIAKAWLLWTNLERLVFWEIRGISRQKENANPTAAATLLYAAAICKKGFVSNTWISYRARLLENDTGLSNIATLPPFEIIDRFFKKYPRNFISKTERYSALSASYTLFSNTNLRSFWRIIEKSIAQNINSATGIATMISKIKGVDVDYLMRLIPADQFTALAELAGHIFNNRFSSLAAIPPQSRYADLTFLGICLEFFDLNLIKTQNYFKRYPYIKPTLTCSQLINIARYLRKSTTAVAQVRNTIFHNVQPNVAHNNQDKHPVRLVGDIPFLTFPQIPENENARNLFIKQQNKKRVDWPLQFKNLPANRVLDQYVSSKGMAFKRLMTRLHETSVQIKTGTVDDFIKTFQKLTALPPDDIQDLITLGVEILPNWRNPPPADIRLGVKAGFTNALYYRPLAQFLTRHPRSSNRIQTDAGPLGAAARTALPTAGQSEVTLPFHQEIPAIPKTLIPVISRSEMPPFKYKIKPIKRKTRLVFDSREYTTNKWEITPEEYKKYVPDNLSKDAHNRFILPPVAERYDYLFKKGFNMYEYDVPHKDFIDGPIKRYNATLECAKDEWSYTMFMNLPIKWMHPLEYQIAQAITMDVAQSFGYALMGNDDIERMIASIDLNAVPDNLLFNLAIDDMDYPKELIVTLNKAGVAHDIFVE